MEELKEIFQNIGLQNFTKCEEGVGFICLMGVGSVFVGLILLIFVCKIMGWLVKGKEQPATATAVPAVQTSVQEQPIENKQELIAAISAAVAEELGTDVSGIRIHSLKRL